MEEFDRREEWALEFFFFFWFERDNCRRDFFWVQAGESFSLYFFKPYFEFLVSLIIYFCCKIVVIGCFHLFFIKYYFSCSVNFENKSNVNKYVYMF